MMKNCGKFRRKGLEEYCKRMSKPRNSGIVDWRVRRVLQKYYKLTGAYEPQSLYDPDKLYEMLNEYGEKGNFQPDEHWDYAISKAWVVFGKRKHMNKMAPDKDAYKTRLKKEKSGGVYMSNKEQSLDEAERHSNLVLKGVRAPNPCLAFATTRKGKTRLVWGYPTDMAILEARFGFQLIDLFKTIRTPITYSLRRIELGARLDATMRGKHLVTLDFSKFDSTIPEYIIKVAFRILKSWFDMSDAENRIAWRTVERYFINTPIVMPDGCLYTGKAKGVPSGSILTQIIDSISNFIALQAALHYVQVFVPSKCIHILGDDSAFSTNSPIDLKVIAIYLLKFGLILNVEKSAISTVDEGFDYLGVRWKHGVPHFELSRVWRSGVYPERWRKYGGDELLNEAVAWRSIVLPLLSIGIEGALLLAKASGFVGPAQLYTQDVSADQPQCMPGYLRYLVEHEGAGKSGLWNPCAFPYSS